MATLQQMSVPAAVGSCLGRLGKLGRHRVSGREWKSAMKEGLALWESLAAAFFVRGLLFQRASASFLYETCPALEKAARYGPFCAQTLRSANSLLCACPKKPSLLRGATIKNDNGEV